MEKVSTPSFEKIVIIGGSAGALDVLFTILPELKKPDYPIIIVLHRKGSEDSGLAALLSVKSSLQVKEVEDKDILKAGSIFLAPGDYHLLFEPDGTLSLDDSEKVAHSRPSIDVSFQSIVDVYGKAVTGILLSGANADGSEGLAYIKAAGGTTIAQAPETAEVAFMPRQAIDGGAACYVFDVPAILAYLNGRITGSSIES